MRSILPERLASPDHAEVSKNQNGTGPHWTTILRTSTMNSVV
jgi:hypothetical protein